MRKALSDKTILALKPKPGRYEVFDALCPGLGLRVSEHGRKTFSVKYYYGTKQRRLRLGHYPIVSLSKVREKAMEEGLTAWIFARAKELNFFEGQDRVSLGILKTIGEFVDGYEVEACPPKLWERAILEGYAVFRQIRDANGGWIVGDRESRTIRYEILESME